MSELQKQLLNIIILFDNDTLQSLKPLLEQKLNSEILKIDSNANINEMDIYDKIDILRAYKVLNDKTPTISYEDALKELGIGGDVL